MNIHNKMLLMVFSLSSMLLTGCSSEGLEAFQTPASATEAPPTGIADQNSFTLARDVAAVEGANFAGSEATVTAYVADRHNHPVPDDTEIRFLTNGGAIEQRCLIEAGTCSVTWNSQDPRPSSGIATIIAYTEGEESFLDLNDNDAFDAGETITDLSEPFIDEIDNNTYDVGSEEFVDRDGDRVFDPPDGLYNGESCIGDNTVCNRTRLFVWDEVPIVMSTSTAAISFTPTGTILNPLLVGVDSINRITITVLDTNGNQMPTGTTISIEAATGTIDTAEFTVGTIAAPVNINAAVIINYTAPAESGAVNIKVTVTSPVSKTETVANLPIIII